MEKTEQFLTPALRAVAARLTMAVIVALPLAFFFKILKYSSYANFPIKLYNGNALLSLIGLIAICYIAIAIFMRAKSSAKDGGSTSA